MGYVMKKWLEIVKNVLIWGIVAFSVIMIIFTLISVNTLGSELIVSTFLVPVM